MASTNDIIKLFVDIATKIDDKSVSDAAKSVQKVFDNIDGIGVDEIEKEFKKIESAAKGVTDKLEQLLSDVADAGAGGLVDSYKVAFDKLKSLSESIKLNIGVSDFEKSLAQISQSLQVMYNNASRASSASLSSDAETEARAWAQYYRDKQTMAEFSSRATKNISGEELAIEKQKTEAARQTTEQKKQAAEESRKQKEEEAALLNVAKQQKVEEEALLVAKKQETEEAKRQKEEESALAEVAKQESEAERVKTEQKRQATEEVRRQREEEAALLNVAKQDTEYAKQATEAKKQQTEATKQATEASKQATEAARKSAVESKAASAEEVADARLQTEQARLQTELLKAKAEEQKAAYYAAKSLVEEEKRLLLETKRVNQELKNRSYITSKIKTDNPTKQDIQDALGGWSDVDFDLFGTGSAKKSVIDDFNSFGNVGEIKEKIVSAFSGISKLFADISGAAASSSSALSNMAGGLSTAAGAAAAAGTAITAVVVAVKALVAAINILLGILKLIIKAITLIIKLAAEIVMGYGKILLAGLKTGYKELQLVLGALNKVAPVLGNIAKISLKPLIGDLFDARKQASGLSDAFNQVKSMLLMYFSVRGLVSLSKQMLTLSSDVIEIQNVVDTVFKDLSGTIDDFAENASQSFGISELAAKKYASTYGAIAQATKMSSENVAKLSVNMTKLTADVASFYNLDHDEVFEKIQSGLTGQVRPLRALGVSVTKANLEAFRLAQGIEKSYNQMNEAERVALRYNFVLDALRIAQGDFSRTSGSWANQIRILTLQIQQLGAVLGGLVQKVIYPVIVALNEMLSVVLTLSRALAKTFGFDAAGLQKQQGLEGQQSGLTMSDEMDDYADSVDDATESQKKLNEEQKKSLANIHQLNVLGSNDSGDSGSSSSTGSGAGVGFGDVSFDLFDYAEVEKGESALEKFLDAIRKKVEEQDWAGLGALLAEKINEGFANIDNWILEHTESILNGVRNFVEVFNSLVLGIDGDLLGRTLGDLGNLGVGIWNTFFDETKWEEIGTKAAESINGFLDAFDSYELGRAFTQTFDAVWGFLKGLVIGDGETELDFELLGKNIADAIKGAIDNIKTEDFRDTMLALGRKVAQAVSSFFSDMLDTVDEEFNDDGSQKTYAQKLGERIADIFEGVVGSALNLIANLPYENIAKTFVQSLNSTISRLSDPDKLAELKSSVAEFFKGIGKVISEAFDPEEGIDFKGAGTIAGTVINSIVNGFNNLHDTIDPRNIGIGIADFISAGIESIGLGDFGTAIGNVIDTLGKALAGFTERLSEKGENGQTGWANIGHNIAAFFNNIMAAINADDLTDGIAGLINGLTEAIQTVLEDLKNNGSTDKFSEIFNKLDEKVDWDEVRDTLKEAIEVSIGKAIELLQQIEWGTWIDDLLGVVWPVVESLLSNGWSFIKNGLLGALKNVLLHFGNDSEFTEVVASIVNGFIPFAQPDDPLGYRVAQNMQKCFLVAGLKIQTDNNDGGIGESVSTVLSDSIDRETAGLSNTVYSSVSGGVSNAARMNYEPALGELAQAIRDSGDEQLIQKYEGWSEKYHGILTDGIVAHPASDYKLALEDLAKVIREIGDEELTEQYETWSDGYYDLIRGGIIDASSEDFSVALDTFASKIRETGDIELIAKYENWYQHYAGLINGKIREASDEDYSAALGELNQIIRDTNDLELGYKFDTFDDTVHNTINGKITEAGRENNFKQGADAISQSFSTTLDTSFRADINAKKPGWETFLEGIFSGLKSIAARAKESIDNIVRGAQSSASTAQSLSQNVSSLPQDQPKDQYQESLKKQAEEWEKNNQKKVDLQNQINQITSQMKTVQNSLNQAKTSENRSYFQEKLNALEAEKIRLMKQLESLPKLATGAVIPPNNQFLAILGDQKHGVNIETPLDTMVDAFDAALYRNRDLFGGTGEIRIPIYVNHELKTEEVIRMQDMARYRSNGK